MSLLHFFIPNFYFLSVRLSIRYVNYHELNGGEEESRKSNYTDLVNKYYDLVTSFYEYGWGDSFHFAGRWPGETVRESIKRHQHFMALQLGLKEGMKVLDVGCGIGGPLVEIARFSSALITGLNNNDYQISRGQVNTLEFLRIAPAGSMRVYNFLRTASEGLLKGGREGIFTANFFILGRKPVLARECNSEWQCWINAAIASDDRKVRCINALHFHTSYINLEVMSKTGAFDLASGLGGSIGKDQVKSAVEQYVKYHDLHGGEEKSRMLNYTDLVNKYYDLATSFYEYGWGDSFHFAGRWHEETFCESIKRHQHFIALQLGLTKGMKVLDVGCGIGGPLIEIARFSSTLITGLNNNDYQMSRGKRGVYREIHRVLKPGQYFALDEWCMTDRFDPNNAKHLAIKAEIELGDGLPDIRTTRQCVQAMKDAGFEVTFAKDLAEDFPCPWYQPMDPSHFSWTSFQCTRPGRFITRAILNTLEFLHIAPAGSMRVYHFLQTASEGLLKGGREGIFTATFFVLGRKPVQETETVNGDL
ncbi:hypothetical protein EJB05_03932 [Eragrostis curvula]|uniref:SAM-dependent methyltransferase Erg6/SMT-type domain-containing protein n=1 Tax=Eragrostis curvula TaxID=38414 RepID=A0A5J9W855_9POAL|nr:hypothetical protein EJB05_03932 [Eragrostis curvula]